MGFCNGEGSILGMASYWGSFQTEEGFELERALYWKSFILKRISYWEDLMLLCYFSMGDF